MIDSPGLHLIAIVVCGLFIGVLVRFNRTLRLKASNNEPEDRPFFLLYFYPAIIASLLFISAVVLARLITGFLKTF